jgi:hypothetical protein
MYRDIAQVKTLGFQDFQIMRILPPISGIALDRMVHALCMTTGAWNAIAVPVVEFVSGSGCKDSGAIGPEYGIPVSKMATFAPVGGGLGRDARYGWV